MRIDVVTIFPEMFDALTRFGITGRALQRGLWGFAAHNPRDFTTDAYRRVDDRPYGGGPGMVMLGQPLADAIGAARAAGESVPGSTAPAGARPVIALSPQGAPLDDAKVRSLAALPGMVLVAGRYEAIDQRLIDRHVDEEISIGDFVVSGGELPAMMLIDAVVRLLPGAMNDEASAAHDSFADGLLDCPHYTRPEVFEDLPVPEVLLSGHHARIARWRRERSLETTFRRRPDLLEKARRNGLLGPKDETFLAALRGEEGEGEGG
jgi:tRNA (guanine37-N1)-methyltransferase